MTETHTQPSHVGFIIDGNRRWAREKNLPTIKGHQAGHKRFREIVEYAFDLGIKEVSAFVFSTENWQRPENEVDYLMNLVRRILRKDIKELHEKDVKLQVIGSREKVADDILEEIDKATENTKDNEGGILNLCFNYGGRNDILEASKELIRTSTSPGEVTEEAFHEHLQSSKVSNLDLVIRTSEARLSNFLLWQSAYAELYFATDVLWPDFNKEEFDKALEEYRNRQRRFGK